MLSALEHSSLTNVMAVVIRYFGGIKLGTSGLIQAYRQAAIEAIEAAEIVEKTIDDDISIHFQFPMMNTVMRVVKDIGPQIVGQEYDGIGCMMTLRIRRSLMPSLHSAFENIHGIEIKESEG